MNLYSEVCEDTQTDVRANFSSIFNAVITVFQIMTLEKWTEILYLCLSCDGSSFITLVYLISWIFLGNYVLLNLFLAVLFDGFHADRS